LMVTSFLGDHPGGELAILTFAGKDATEEFDMIHPPDVVGKYAPDAIIGVVGTAPVGAAVSAAPPSVSKAKGAQKTRNYQKADNNKKIRMAGEGKIKGWVGAVLYMALGFMLELVYTIFGQKNLQFTKDRVGLTRSAMWLFLFLIIHAVGNLHIFLGPDDFNGYGYFYVRLYWFRPLIEANIVEIYVAFGAMLHVMVALKRTWEISLMSSIESGKMNLAISGICLLTFMIIHLFQFRFGATRDFLICPPTYFINLQGIMNLEAFNLFWVQYNSSALACMDIAKSKPIAVRDIYRLEFELFSSLGWCVFYVSSVIIFATHMCLGWRKCIPTPQMDIPKRYHNKAIHLGYIMTAFIAFMYVSFPFYTHMCDLGTQGWSPTSTAEMTTIGDYNWASHGAA